MSADCLVIVSQVSAWLRVRQGLAEDNKVCCGHWGHGDGAPFTPTPCSGAVKGRKGIEGSLLSWQGAQRTGQPAQAQSGDVIGKCSNQEAGGSALYTTHPRRPASASSSLGFLMLPQAPGSSAV